MVWVALCLLLTPVWVATGADASARFDAANKLYEQGKYAEAIQAYEDMIRSGTGSAAVYFNLGNALFKQGQVGRAIAAYHSAQIQAPRDPDVRANLGFARDKVEGNPPRTARWERWSRLLTANEATVMATILFWLWLLLLTAGELRRDWAPALRQWTFLTGVAALMAIAVAGALAYLQIGIREAVVITQQAVVRYGPFDEAQAYFTARDGWELRVLGRKDQWLQVADGSRRIGWVPSTNLLLLR
jgi:tetratricopeptide (TPR) repeat protein